ncbi:MAG TPA: flagellar hook-basal body complex protein [Povalibacter sp.]|uniref:flagellar hook protein FlgE n=1 Tax=Povalibacter sp. TaxID=1962978 RepID=UPI002BFAA3A9|nr:flagellar hook-basal body complex protein [Povalibacter sp.]HMN43136.1 flagellar hook-basal body complex protein [Povalibacter sp.]
MSFNIALSGINAINTELNTISNNIANSGTYGFKSSRANFASMYAGTQPTGTEVSSLTQSIEIGGGVLTTGRGMDASIQGRGFFVTRDTTGAEVYTRVGIFSTDANGYVVDSFGRRVQGYAAVPGATTLGAMGDLQVATGQIPAQASTTLNYVGNLSADWTAPTVTPFDRTDPLSFNGSLVSVVYDSLGVQHSVTQYFVKSGVNQATVHYTFDGVDQPATTVLDFDTSGQLVAPAGAVPIAFGTPPGAAPLTVAISYAGTTQTAGEATTSTNAANGYASGTFLGVQLSSDGSVLAQYSNGQKQSIGTIALATFPAEGQLVPISDTAWTTSTESGAALYSAPGSGMAGRLTPGALEQSNVDMTAQLVNLMSAQRNYQANTKVISAENEMMQTLMQAV